MRAGSAYDRCPAQSGSSGRHQLGNSGSIIEGTRGARISLIDPPPILQSASCPAAGEVYPEPYPCRRPLLRSSWFKSCSRRERRSPRRPILLFRSSDLMILDRKRRSTLFQRRRMLSTRRLPARSSTFSRPWSAMLCREASMRLVKSYHASVRSIQRLRMRGSFRSLSAAPRKVNSVPIDAANVRVPRKPSKTRRRLACGGERAGSTVPSGAAGTHLN